MILCIIRLIRQCIIEYNVPINLTNEYTTCGSMKTISNQVSRSEGSLLYIFTAGQISDTLWVKIV